MLFLTFANILNDYQTTDNMQYVNSIYNIRSRYSKLQKKTLFHVLTYVRRLVVRYVCKQA